VITVSTSCARGARQDHSGPALATFAARVGARVVGTEVIPDELELIEGRLRFWCDEGGCELVLTTGGAGLAPEHVTPEATVAVLERPMAGIAEAMRLASREDGDEWMLFRGVAGSRGRSLIVNFPADPPAIERAGAAIEAALPRALSLLARRGAH
jgi:molybdenum cofactor synthesis domain-containing protein